MTDRIPDISTDMEIDILIEIEILSWAQLNFSFFCGQTSFTKLVKPISQISTQPR